MFLPFHSKSKSFEFCVNWISHFTIAILAIYRFDAMFDTKSALPDFSQNFETFILQTCTNTQAKSKLSKGIFTLFWRPWFGIKYGVKTVNGQNSYVLISNQLLFQLAHQIYASLLISFVYTITSIHFLFLFTVYLLQY